MNKSIFISYSSKDSHFVGRLSRDLRGLGQDVWLDKFKIKVGDSIPGKIGEGLANSDFFLIVLSPNSVGSKWVFSELETALNEQYSGRLEKILPVMLRECEIPTLLRKIKYADCSREYENGFGELINALGLGLHNDSSKNYNLSLEAMLKAETKMWLSKDFTEQSRSEWKFIEIFKRHDGSSEIFVKAIIDYLYDLLIYQKDIYTEDRVRVAARVIDVCNFSDPELAPALIQHLSHLAEYGIHRKPIDDLVKGLKACWDERYRGFLNDVVNTYPSVEPIEI